MQREVQRLKAIDAKYGLDFANKAENLVLKFEEQQKINNDLLYEIDGIPYKRDPCKGEDFPIIGSGGLYLRFGNNRTQEEINKAALRLVQKGKKL